MPNTYPPTDFISFFSDNTDLTDQEKGDGVLSIGHIISYHALGGFMLGSSDAFTIKGDFSPAVEGDEVMGTIFPVSGLATRKEMTEILSYIEKFTMNHNICLYDPDIYEKSPYARIQSFVNESGAKHKVFFFGIKDEKNKTNIMGGVAIDINDVVDQNEAWESFLRGGGVTYLFSIPEDLLLASSVIFENYLIMTDNDKEKSLDSLIDNKDDAIVLDEWTD